MDPEMVSSKPIPRENRFRMNRLIIISNRLPVTIERQENQFQFKKSVGGLATGMSSVYRDYEGDVGRMEWAGKGTPLHSGV
jgi:trehalose-6-phosphate synthase